MNSNTITLSIELGPNTQAKLDQILQALLDSRPNCHSCVETAVAMTKDLADAATASLPVQEVSTPETVPPAEEVGAEATPEPAVEPEPIKWTKDDLTAKVRQLAAPGTGKREAVRDIVKAYAENVGSIPEDKYAEVMDKLTALEQEG